MARAYRITQVRSGYKNAVYVPRVLCGRAYRTSRSSGYGYERPTEVTEDLCTVIRGVNSPGTVCKYPTEHNLVMFRLFLNRTESQRKTFDLKILHRARANRTNL